MTVHAELSASSAERWWNCPGSIGMIRNLISLPPPSIFAHRGSAMHMAAAQWLESGREPDWALETFLDIELEQDEVEAVQYYVQVIRDDQVTHGGRMLIEHRFNLKSLRDGMFGTNDAMLIQCPDRVLRVYDFKGGAGIAVDVENNFQLLYYGYGAILNIKGVYDTIELNIVQPRCRHRDGPLRRWRIDLIDAFDWAQDLMRAAARTDGPNAPLKAGEWCRFCPAAGNCKEHERYALESAALEFAQADGLAPLPDPRAMSPEELARIMPGLSIFEDWIALVRSFVHGEAEAGRVLPGFKLVARRGTRNWQVPESDVIAALKNAGAKEADLFKRKLVSPAQAEKLLKKSERAIVNRMALSVSSGTNLVPEDDPRPAIEGGGVAVFSPVPDGQLQIEDQSP